MKRLSSIFFFCLFLSVTLRAQTPTAAPPKSDEDVVKITTKLVQLDAVVTDKDGNQVRNLNADDFEILQDGKPQKIINFSYVNTDSTANQPILTTTKKADKNAVLSPPPRTSVANAGRVLTFIVDDGNCAASQIGMIAARESLEKFIGEQMLPNDLVAIYQTRGGSSLLQQYTSDKTQLLRTAHKIRWFPSLNGCGNRGGDIFEAARNDAMSIPGKGNQTFESAEDRQRREAGEDFGRDNQVLGTIGVLRYVVRGLERVGGRKVVFLLSDGFPLFTRDNSVSRSREALRDLTDLANRASVVFNTIDDRGVVNTSMINAGDEVSTRADPDVAKPTGTDKLVAERTAEFNKTRDGLFFLANETGGKFYHDQNFLDVPIRRALSLEKGYYLLAYDPEDDTFKGKNFNKIEIKLKRPELRVSSRAGFVGTTDEAAKSKKRTGDSELYEAIFAPLPRAGLNLQLTAFFGNTPTEGSFVRSLLHLDGNEIAFTDEPNGFKKAVFDVVAVTLDEKNEVIDEFNRTHTFKVEAAAIPLIKQNGLIYTTDVPVKKAGTYNFRVALRDASSKMLGSASQVIQIPDLKKSKIFLSGLTVSAVDANGKFISPSAVKPENALSLTAATDVPAIRRFRRGEILAYAYTLYNAQMDKATNQPKLSIQTNYYRDGKIVAEGKPQAADLEKQTDWTRINDYGYVRLKPELETGDYTLQIIVKDLLTNQTTSQWIDFEVIE